MCECDSHDSVASFLHVLQCFDSVSSIISVLLRFSLIQLRRNVQSVHGDSSQCKKQLKSLS